jgi:hypothetical protein
MMRSVHREHQVQIPSGFHLVTALSLDELEMPLRLPEIENFVMALQYNIGLVRMVIRTHFIV